MFTISLLTGHTPSIFVSFDYLHHGLIARQPFTFKLCPPSVGQLIINPSTRDSDWLAGLRFGFVYAYECVYPGWVWPGTRLGLWNASNVLAVPNMHMHIAQFIIVYLTLHTSIP